jgi:sorting nexin-1/2
VTVSDPQRASPATTTTTAAASLYAPLLLSTPHLSYRVAGDTSLPGFACGGPDPATAATTTRSSFSVRRRFSDFAALRSLLTLHHRGYVVPPLPDKSFLDAKVAALTAPDPDDGGKTAAAASPFVAVRSADLSAFMRAVVEHPVLRQSAALRVFLTHSDGAEGAWKEAAAAAEAAAVAPSSSSSLSSSSPSLSSSPRPASQQPSPWRAALPSGGVLALRCKHSLLNAAASITAVASAKQSPSSLLPPAAAATAAPPSFSAAAPPNLNTSAASPLPPIPLCEDELALRAAREANAELERLLGGAVAASRSLVGRMAALASDFNALGASLAAFSRWEDARARRGGQYTSEGARSLERATVLQTAALGGGRSEHLLRSGAARAASHLVGLHDLLALVPETAAVLEARERTSADLLVLETEARDRLVYLQRARDAEAAAPFIAAEQAAAAAAAGPKSREARRVAAAKIAYESAEAQAAAVRSSYAEEARRNRSEVDRLSALRSSGQRAALEGFARSQRELAGAYGELWASIEGQLQTQEQFE